MSLYFLSKNKYSPSNMNMILIDSNNLTAITCRQLDYYYSMIQIRFSAMTVARAAQRHWELRFRPRSDRRAFRWERQDTFLPLQLLAIPDSKISVWYDLWTRHFEAVATSTLHHGYRPRRITPAAMSFWIFIRTWAFLICSCKAEGSFLACCRMVCITGS
jgi:hypothetical protein